MPEPDWHALLDDAVPTIETPSDAMSELEISVRRVRRRRRWVAVGSPVAVALVVAGIVVSGSRGAHPSTAAITTPRSATTVAVTRTPTPVVTPSVARPAVTSARPTNGPSAAALLDACKRYGSTGKRSLPADFVAAGATECAFDVRRIPGDGTWQVRVVQRLSGDLAPLLAALNELHPTADPSFGCTLNYDGDPPVVLFAGDGSPVTPAIPRDTCSHVSAAVMDALGSLTSQTLGVLKVKRVKTEAQDVDASAASAAGCPTTAKEPFHFPLPKIRSSAASFAWWPQQAVVCVYDDDPIDEHYGDFVAGRPLTGAASSALQQAIDRPGNRLGCASLAGKTMVIEGADGSYVQVELSTCWRVVRQDGATRSIGAADKNAVLAVLGDLAR